MSLFGASANTSSAPGTGLFGSSTTSSMPASGGSMFGNTNAQTRQTPSLFGNTQQQQQPQQQGGTSLFGNTQQQQQPQQQGGTSLFGNTQQQQPQQQGSTSLFGNTGANANTTATGANSLFGSNTQGGGFFGAKPAGTSTPAATGGGLFGSATTTTSAMGGSSLFGNTTQQQPAAGTGGSLFGSTPAAPTAGNSLFGNPAQQPASGTGTNSFFSTPPAGQQQQNVNQAKPSLFGSSTPPNPLFAGSTNANTTNTGTGTSFGGGNPATAGTTGPLFGTTSTSNTGNSLFGSNNVGATSGGFGSSTLGVSAFGNKPATPGGNLGTSTLGTSNLGTSTLGTQNQGQDAQVQFTRLQEKIEAVAGAWNASNPALCRFQHYFYNLVDPVQVNLYTRPPNAVKEDLWQKAVRENPDPSCLVPVLAIGYDGMRDRVDAQTQQSTAHKEKLTELQSRMRTLTTHHTTTTIPRLQRYSALQTQLLHRLLKLVTHLHLLIPSVRSSAIGEAEEELKSQLEEVASEVGISRSSATGDNSARKGGRLKSKLGELWAVIGALKAREEGLNAMTGGGEWKVVDEEGLARIAQVLAEQQAGLAHLTKILQKDLKDVAVVMGTETRT